MDASGSTFNNSNNKNKFNIIITIIIVFTIILITDVKKRFLRFLFFS